MFSRFAYYEKRFSFQVERDRTSLIVNTFKQLNTQFNRRTNTSGPPLAVHRVKVTFKDEPGEGSGVARSFYTALANVSEVFLTFRKPDRIYFLSNSIEVN